MKPEIFVPNFLTDKEVKSVLRSVLELKKYWVPFDKMYPEWGMLPLGLYYIPSQKYIWKMKPIMKNSFDWLYVKLKEVFNSDYHDDLSYPGFHVFARPGEKTSLNFHIDGFDHPLIRHTKITSYILPITLPKEKTGLIYSVDNNLTNREAKEDGKEYQTFYYNVGDLCTWDGNLQHSMGTFNIGENESRITLQFHVSDAGYIFW